MGAGKVTWVNSDHISLYKQSLLLCGNVLNECGED